MGWQREVAAACQRAGAAHLDLLVPFVETPHVYGKIDKEHPSPHGQRVVAQQVTEKLVSLGWIEATR
jgi:hypothetical protein